jgi:hypothetical protein
LQWIKEERETNSKNHNGKTRRKFNCSRGEGNRKWVDNPISPSKKKTNLDLKLHQSVHNMEFTVVKPKEARWVDVEETSKNQQGAITAKDGSADHHEWPWDGVLVVCWNSEYDSDATIEMAEEVMFQYKRVIKTVKEDDKDGKRVIKTVENNDEDDEVF